MEKQEARGKVAQESQQVFDLPISVLFLNSPVSVIVQMELWVETAPWFTGSVVLRR